MVQIRYDMDDMIGEIQCNLRVKQGKAEVETISDITKNQSTMKCVHPSTIVITM